MRLDEIAGIINLTFALIFQAQLQKRHPVQQAQPNPADQVTKPPIRVTRIHRKYRKSPNPEVTRKDPSSTHFRQITPNISTTPLALFHPIGKKLIRIRASRTSLIIIPVSRAIFWLFWVIFRHFGSFLAILCHFRPFWPN